LEQIEKGNYYYNVSSFNIIKKTKWKRKLKE
jgi:hypothetical protein